MFAGMRAWFCTSIPIAHVCVWEDLCICQYIDMYIYMCAHTHKHANVCVCACTRACLRVYERDSSFPNTKHWLPFSKENIFFLKCFQSKPVLLLQDITISKLQLRNTHTKFLSHRSNPTGANGNKDCTLCLMVRVHPSRLPASPP